MSSPCGHPGGGSGDLSGNVLCKVCWSKTPAYNCFGNMAAKLLPTLMLVLVFLCVCEGGELYSWHKARNCNTCAVNCANASVCFMSQLCWGNPRRRSSFRKWRRSVPQSVFPKIAAQKLASWRKWKRYTQVPKLIVLCFPIGHNVKSNFSLCYLL